jgi:hypothetical protein
MRVIRAQEDGGRTPVRGAVIDECYYPRETGGGESGDGDQGGKLPGFLGRMVRGRPQQPPWQRFLDEVAEAGYEGIG